MTALDGVSIAIVGVHYAPETSGNAPYTTAMAEALAAAGARVHVITGVPHYPQWEVTDPRYFHGRTWDESVNGVRLTRCRHHVPSTPNLAGRGRMEASFFRGASRVLRTDRSSIVIAVTPTLAALGAAVAFRRARPLGVLVQDLTGRAAGESGSTGGRVAEAIGAAEYALLRRCDRIGVITPRFQTVLAANGVPESRIARLENFSHITPVDTAREDARRRLGWREGRFTVVHTGNMGRKQGLETLVAAARLSDQRGHDVDFVLVGDGNQRRALVESAADLPNLRFVAPLEEDQYPYALAAADVLLLCEAPGVQEMSLPSKLTSYTAAGRPILASVQGGGITEAEVRRFGAAVVTTAGDPEDLLRGLDELRASPALTATIVRNGQQMFHTQYGRAAAHARYVQFAQDLRGSTNGARSSSVVGQRAP